MGLRDRIADFFGRLFGRRRELPPPEDDLVNEFGRVKGTTKEEIGKNNAALEAREKGVPVEELHEASSENPDKSSVDDTEFERRIFEASMDLQERQDQRKRDSGVSEFTFDLENTETPTKTKSIGEMIQEFDVQQRADREKTNIEPHKKEEKVVTETHHEEEIDIGLDDLSRVKISDSANSKTVNSEGQIRQDRRIDVKGNDGEFHRTSNLFMGYNKEGFDLPNGEYVSVDEINAALEKALQPEENSEKTRTIKCKTTGKVVDPEELKKVVAGVAFANVKFDIRDKAPESSKVTNQETTFIRLRNERDEFIRKGLLMLGNGKITLPNGEYVSKKDIEVALSNYLFDVKEVTEEPILIIPGNDGDSKGPEDSHRGIDDLELPPFLTGEDEHDNSEGSSRKIEPDDLELPPFLTGEDEHDNSEGSSGKKESDDLELPPFLTGEESNGIGEHEESGDNSFEIDIPAFMFDPNRRRVRRMERFHSDDFEEPELSEDDSEIEEAAAREKQKEEEERKRRREKYTPKHAKAKVKKTGRRWKVWPIVLASVATLALGHYVKTTPQAPLETPNAKYVFSEMAEKDRLETEDEVIRRINSQFEIGQTIEVPDGVAVYQSSDHIRGDANQRYGVYGESQLLISGPVQVEYISLLDQNGRIVQVTYDKEQDATVEDAVQRAVREQGFDVKTGHVMIHISGLGPTGEYTRGGWADQQDLVTNEQRTQQVVLGQETGYRVEGQEENFENAVTFKNSSGEEVRAVFPEDTEYDSLAGKSMTTVDGKTYRINEFEVGTTQTPVKDEVAIKWDFEHVKERKALAALFGLVGIAGFAAVNKQKVDDTKEKAKKDEEERSF